MNHIIAMALTALKEERGRIDVAIAALEQVGMKEQPQTAAAPKAPKAREPKEPA